MGGRGAGTGGGSPRVAAVPLLFGEVQRGDDYHGPARRRLRQTRVGARAAVEPPVALFHSRAACVPVKSPGSPEGSKGTVTSVLPAQASAVLGGG